MNEAVAPSTRDLAASYAYGTDWSSAVAAASGIGRSVTQIKAAAGVGALSRVAASVSPTIAGLAAARDISTAHMLATSILEAAGIGENLSNIASLSTSSWATTIGQAASIAATSQLAGFTSASLITKLGLHDDRIAALGSLGGIQAALASEGMNSPIASAIGQYIGQGRLPKLGMPLAEHQTLLARMGLHNQTIRKFSALYPAAQTAQLAGLATGYADWLTSARPSTLLDASLAARAVRAEWAQSPIARAATEALTQLTPSLPDSALENPTLLPDAAAAGWAAATATQADLETPLRWSRLRLSDDQRTLLRRHGVTWVGAFTFFDIVLNHLVDTEQHAIDILWWASTLATVFTLAVVRRQN